jgi:hypothetical protein
MRKSSMRMKRMRTLLMQRLQRAKVTAMISRRNAAAVVVVGRSLVRGRASSRPSLVRRPKVVMRMQRAMRPRQRLQNLQLRSMLTHL